MKKLTLVIVFGLLLISFGSAQTQTIRMMHYNLLFYTETSSSGCNSSTNNLNTKDAALQSGASTHALKEKFDGNITPMDHMLRVLNGERYSMIHA